MTKYKKRNILLVIVMIIVLALSSVSYYIYRSNNSESTCKDLADPACLSLPCACTSDGFFDWIKI